MLMNQSQYGFSFAKISMIRILNTHYATTLRTRPGVILTRMQSERYWIERSFQDAIDLAGMADYLVRNWDAWHHHMALVLLAMLWIAKEQKHFLSVKKMMTLQDVALIIQTRYH